MLQRAYDTYKLQNILYSKRSVAETQCRFEQGSLMASRASYVTLYAQLCSYLWLNVFVWLEIVVMSASGTKFALS